MRHFTKRGSAFAVAALVAGGMVTFSAPIAAAGPGGGKSGTTLCALLANAEAVAQALPDSDVKTALLANIDERQAALGCGA